MKKVLLGITSVLMVLTMFILTGCSSAPIFKLTGTYFLDDPETLSVGDVYEESVYSVTFEANSKSSVQLKLDSGKYVTRLFTSEYEGVRCYEYQTELKTAGSYVINEETQAFEDTIETVCYFLGVDNSLKPLYSKRTVKAHSIVAKTDGYFVEYFVEYYEYVIETKYSNNSATVTFTPDEDNSDGSYSLAAGEHKFDKVFANTYFDNEMMLIAIRTMDLDGGYSATFSTIDSISNAKRQLQLSPDAENPSETLEISYTNSGEKINNVETFKFGLAVTGTFTGSTIILNYASRTQPKEGQRLVKMQVEAPLSLGNFTYTITSVTKDAK